MRNVLLVCLVGVSSLSLYACGDASSTSLVPTRGGAGAHVPDAEGNDQANHDPNDPGDQNNGTADPNATSKPAPPTTQGTTSGSFSVAVDNNTPQSDLEGSVDVNVTLTQVGTFTGSVTLSVTGLPTGVTGTFSPASVTIASAPVTSKLTFKAPYSATPSAAGVAVQIVGTSGATTASANATFKVNNAITMHIPVNATAMAAANDAYGAAFTGTTKFQSGLAVKVMNDDSTAHVIHGQNGFAHGDTNTGNEIKPNSLEMQNGSPRVRNLNAGTPNGYLHDKGDGASPNFAFSF